jgi:hypothetical protein
MVGRRIPHRRRARPHSHHPATIAETGPFDKGREQGDDQRSCAELISHRLTLTLQERERVLHQRLKVDLPEPGAPEMYSECRSTRLSNNGASFSRPNPRRCPRPRHAVRRAAAAQTTPPPRHQLDTQWVITSGLVLGVLRRLFQGGEMMSILRETPLPPPVLLRPGELTASDPRPTDRRGGLAHLRHLLASHPDWCRRRLSQQLARDWE